MGDAVDDELTRLATRHGLPGAAVPRFRLLLAALERAPISLSSVRDPAVGARVHVADSLSALALPELCAASRLADLGSGGGFPGLPLAIALPSASVTLIESAAKKCAFLARTTEELALTNVVIVNARVEEWEAGRGSQDIVCARAVAPLGVLVEYAAPILRVGGFLVAWKGRVDAAERDGGEAAAQVVGMGRARVVPSGGEHGLYLYESLSSVTNRFPRRPGMARKRPLGPSS